MNDKSFEMTPQIIVNTLGTVGSPLIVMTELIKNAVDASAQKIHIHYDTTKNRIVVKNDGHGFALNDLNEIFHPGDSSKKKDKLENDYGLFMTGSKGLGLLSVFLLTNEAEILTVADDDKTYKVILNKAKATVTVNQIKKHLNNNKTYIILKNINKDSMRMLASNDEITKLKHICTYAYKKDTTNFPEILLKVANDAEMSLRTELNFSNYTYEVSFRYDNKDKAFYFKCLSSKTNINNQEIKVTNFDRDTLNSLIHDKYHVKDTLAPRIISRTKNTFNDFTTNVPYFEGRMFVYENKNADSSLKEYGPGINIYVNEFALYNYLDYENDWLGFAHLSQRTKITRLKPHNVFGYVNFPKFNDLTEQLKISNERADFIQDVTYSRLMYLLKGVLLFFIFNIDVAEKNPKFKLHDETKTESTGINNEQDKTRQNPDSNDEDKEANDEKTTDNQKTENDEKENDESNDNNTSSNKHIRAPKIPNNRLLFTEEDFNIINGIKTTNDITVKITNLAKEISSIDINSYKYATACLYRTLIESATKLLSSKTGKFTNNEKDLPGATRGAAEFLGNMTKDKRVFTSKKAMICKKLFKDDNCIDVLNEFIHNETPVDIGFLRDKWGTAKSYIMACIKYNNTPKDKK